MDHQSFPHNIRSVDLHPLGSLTSLVILALMVTALVSVLQIFACVSDIDLAKQVGSGVAVSERELDLHESKLQQLFFLELGVMLITGIFFINWFHRAYSNVAKFDSAGVAYPTKWAIWGWLIPVLNAFRPYKIAQEIWQKSVVKPSGSIVALASGAGSSLVGFWWGSAILMGVSNRIASRLSQSAENLDEGLFADYAIIAAEAITVVAAFVAITFVRELSARHERAIRSYQSPVNIPGSFQPRSS